MQNSKEKFPHLFCHVTHHLAVKKCSKQFFVSAVLSSNPSARHKNFRWPVMIENNRKI